MTEQVVTPEPTPTIDASNIIVNIVEETLIDLVKKSLEKEGIKGSYSDTADIVIQCVDKVTITLTPEIISIIDNIITLTPNILTDIEKTAIEIIKDGKIDSKDIPNLIVVVQQIYQFIYSLKSIKLDAKKRAHITAEILKYIIHLLVLERKIKFDEDPAKIFEFYAQINALIDSCISLLSYSKSLKTKGCLRKLFG
jgi:hypothetical protein